MSVCVCLCVCTYLFPLQAPLRAFEAELLAALVLRPVIVPLRALCRVLWVLWNSLGTLVLFGTKRYYMAVGHCRVPLITL